MQRMLFSATRPSDIVFHLHAQSRRLLSSESLDSESSFWALHRSSLLLASDILGPPEQFLIAAGLTTPRGSSFNRSYWDANSLPAQILTMHDDASGGNYQR